MDVNDLVFKEFVKNGYAKKNGNKLWDIAQRKFLYLTEEQSKSFLGLRKFDVYRKQIIDREIDLIKENASKIAEDIGDEPFNLVDIYCGDGTKACELIKSLGKDIKIRYCPVNVNEYLVNLASENIKKEGFPNVVEVCPIISDGDPITLRNLEKKIKTSEFNRNVVLLLGTVLASYEINDYLFEISRNMKKNDYLLIGNGIRTGERLVEIEKYKSKPLNDWFIHLVKELGLEEADVEYDAQFGNSRIEMFYRMKVDKMIENNGKKVELKKGDEILTTVLYKYFEEEFDKFCKMYFSEICLTTDKDEGYALVLCKK